MTAYTYTEIQDNNILKTISGKYTPINLKCHRCGIEYKKIRKYVTVAITIGTIYNFCSSKCAGKFLRPHKLPESTLNCPYCKTDFILTGKDFNLRTKRQTQHIFCSFACRSKFYNIRSSKHMRSISKMEKWIQDELSNEFISLNIAYNNRNVCDGLELDIFIQELNLAFELNGIFHYLPIFGEDRLVTQTENDIKKNDICKKLNIKLITIDTSKPNRFSEKIAKKYFDEIKRKINESLP